MIPKWKDILKAPVWNMPRVSDDKRVLATHKTYEVGKNIELYYPYRGHERKPKGLWYGFGDSWLHWISYEMPYLSEKYNNVYEIKVTGNILKLVTREEHKEFYEMYKKYDDYPLYEPIEWERVQRDYDGIEVRAGDFSPYERIAEDGLKWLDPFDVNSGCVWTGTVTVVKNLFSKENNPQWEKVE